MAAPTLTLTTSTSISTAESTTGWTTFDTLDPDIVKEGSNGITGTFRADGANGNYNSGTAPITAAGKTFRMWINTTNVAYMDTEANGGYELWVNDGTTDEYKTVFSSDDYYGGWFNIVYDMDAFTTLTLANVEQWGLRVQHHTSAKNVDNVWVDALKYLDGYSMTGGTSPDPITLADIEIADRGTTTLYGYGVVTEFGGVYYCTGDVQFGTGATTMFFEMDGEILIFEDKPVAAGLYSLSGVGTGSTVTIQNNSTIASAGTTDATRFVFDWSDSNLLSFTCTNSLVVRASTVTFKSGQTVTGNTFNDCGQITHAGADMDNCTVKGYEGTANTSALIYNVNADPDGEMDGMTFEKGTAATHAIEFGTLVPATMTLRDCTFTDYNASDTQNDSTFHFKDTGGTITLNLVGCTGNFSYRTDGATIVISIDPVTELVNVKAAGSNYQNARVFVETAATIASGEIFEAAVTSLTQATGTATCTTTAVHGLATNDYVVIRGAQPDGYNKVAQVTVSSTTVFTYSVDSGLSSPATGTPIVSFVAVYGLSDASGNVSSTRTWGANQQLKGWVRNTVAGAPYYKQAELAYTVDNVNGNTTNVALLSDE